MSFRYSPFKFPPHFTRERGKKYISWTFICSRKGKKRETERRGKKKTEQRETGTEKEYEYSLNDYFSLIFMPTPPPMVKIQRFLGLQRTLMITHPEVFQTVSQKSLEYFGNPEGHFGNQRKTWPLPPPEPHYYYLLYLLGLWVTFHSKTRFSPTVMQLEKQTRKVKRLLKSTQHQAWLEPSQQTFKLPLLFPHQQELPKQAAHLCDLKSSFRWRLQIISPGDAIQCVWVEAWPSVFQLCLDNSDLASPQTRFGEALLPPLMHALSLKTNTVYF